MTYPLPLKGFDSVFDSTLNEEIEDALVEYFDWALLRKGNYFNVDLGERNEQGLDMSALSPEYEDGELLTTVWHSSQKDWVWQYVESKDQPPTIASQDPAKPGIPGVYIDGVLYPPDTTGQYAYKINYINGTVRFDNPVDVTTNVQVAFSHKWISVTYVRELPWFKKVQSRLSGPDTSFFENKQGDWTLPPINRLQLPAIAIEVVPPRRFKPYQIGGGQIVYTDVLFHCLASNENVRDKLVDIVSYQNDRRIDIFNSNKVAKAGDFPFDHYGSPIPNAKTFPELVAAYPGYRMTFDNARSQGITTMGDLQGATVRVTVETVKLDI